LVYPIERPDERLLRELLGEIVIPSQVVGKPVRVVYVRFVQLPFRRFIAAANSRDQSCFVHPTPRGW
jgi:hypothetical protein